MHGGEANVEEIRPKTLDSGTPCDARLFLSSFDGFMVSTRPE
jgi:hypothetical protein